VDDISDEYFLESYIGGLKENIKHDILLIHPTNIIKAMQCSHHIQSKNKATHKSSIGAYAGSIDHFWVHKTTIPQPTSWIPQKMDERREKGLFSNCDNK
jgi:hypothetical protein